MLRIIQELWRTSGGAFNVDDVLQTMVRGLADELDSRAERLTEDAYAAPDAARGLTPEQQRAFEALDASDSSNLSFSSFVVQRSALEHTGNRLSGAVRGGIRRN